jgi:hypothetical protein
MARSYATLVATVLLALLSPPALAADHNDAPLISEDPTVDLLDVFAFVSPDDEGKVVLALTTNGFTVPGALGIGFAQNALYEFKIDNDGDFVEDVVVQATFTKIGSSQQVTVFGPAAPRRKGAKSLLLRDSDIKVTGAANGTTLTSADGTTRVFAGPRDDPFFVDLIWVLRQIGVLAGGPLDRENGIDFLAGLNCSVLVVELPASALTSEGNDIRVWGTGSRPNTVKTGIKKDPSGSGPFIQVDATAFPVVNTVINSALANAVAQKDTFNRTPPNEQAALFRQTAIDALVAIGALDAAGAAGLVDALIIPDVLRLDVTSTAGFPNGRKPDDDVIDTILGAASDGGLTSDGVDANDVENPEDFPFFAIPHTAAEGVPARDAL